MSDGYLLESGTDRLLLEDGSGIYTLDTPLVGAGAFSGSGTLLLGPATYGNSVSADRASATDTSPLVLVALLNTPLPAGVLADFQTWNQSGSAGYTFNAYVLHPTGTLNQYTVAWDSGTLTVPPLLSAGGSNVVTWPAGVTVSAGDVFAVFGRGIPNDVGAGVDMYYPAIAPAGTFTLGAGSYPEFSQLRTYSVAPRMAVGAPAITGTCTLSGGGALSFNAVVTRTNQCTNPSFETDTAGWSVWGSGGSPTVTNPSGGAGWAGDRCARLTATTTGRFILTGQTFAVSVGQPFSISAYVRGTTGRSVAMRALWDVSGEILGGSTAITGSYQRVTYWGTVPAGNTTLRVDVDVAASGSIGDYVEIDSVLVEWSGTVGAYFDGSTAAAPALTYAWTGAANGSTSTQSASVGNPAITATVSLSGAGALNTTGVPAPGGADTLSGAGALSVSGAPAIPGTAPLTGSGTLSLTGMPGYTGTAALTGSGTLGLAGMPGYTGTLALSGSGALGVSGTPAITAVASLSGAGALGVSGVPGYLRTAALSGAGTLAFAGGPAISGAPTLSGTGTLSAAGVLGYSGAATLSGGGTLAIGEQEPEIHTTATLSGSGALTLTGLPWPKGGAAALNGAGTLSGAGAPGLLGSVALAGAGALSATGTPKPAASAALAGAGTLGPVGSALTVTGTASLSGSGALIVVGGQSTNVPLSGAGTLTVTGSAPTIAVAVALNGSGALSATGAAGLGSGATLTGLGTLSTSGVPAVAAAATLGGSGALSTTRSLTTSGAASLSGAGTLGIGGAPGHRGTATLGGSGALGATGVAVEHIDAYGTTTLTGAGSLSASGTPRTRSAAGLSGDGSLTLTAIIAASQPLVLSGDGSLTLEAAAVSIGGSADLSGGGLLAVIGHRPPPDVDMSGSLPVRRWTGTNLRARSTVGALGQRGWTGALPPERVGTGKGT